MNVIAKIYNNYDEKFGIPRQSGLVENESIIVFEPEYRIPEALRGIEEFNYLWIIWIFSECNQKNWSPTVRPPKLGGNKRIGVFATRSPFRPNSIGLSSVKLTGIETTEDKGIIIKVSGADMKNGTPIIDIKPYLKYADCHTDANNGFAISDVNLLNVKCDNIIRKSIPDTLYKEIESVLSRDPRPGYKSDSERQYGMSYAGYNIIFKVNNDILTIIEISKDEKQ